MGFCVRDSISALRDLHLRLIGYLYNRKRKRCFRGMELFVPRAFKVFALEANQNSLQNPKFAKILLVESRIQLKESSTHYRLESRIQVSLTKTGIQHLESTIEGCFQFPYMGRTTSRDR